MTNQMKLFLKVALIASLMSVVVSLIALFVGGVGYLYATSYIFLGLSVVTFLVMLVMYLNMKSDERAFKRQIAYYRLLKELRNKAILDFYNKFGIKPQYNKDGTLMTPDELLGILTSLDKEGKLDPSIYERLGILPKFDKNGKEIPMILVLKHLIRAIKVQGLQDVTKLKGLYAKGTRVVQEEKKVAKKDNKAKAQAKAAKKGGGKKEKKSFNGVEVKPDGDLAEYKVKSSGKKPESKAKSAPAVKPKEEVKPQVQPEVRRVEPADIEQANDDYLKKMYARREQEIPRPEQSTKEPVHAEYGECTPE